MIWNLIGAAIIIYLGHKLADRLRGWPAVRHVPDVGTDWPHLDRKRAHQLLHSDSGVAHQRLTAIIVFVIGCILFIVLYTAWPRTPRYRPGNFAAVTADELERQSIEEERLRQKKSQRGNMQ